MGRGAAAGLLTLFGVADGPYASPAPRLDIRRANGNGLSADQHLDSAVRLARQCLWLARRRMAAGPVVGIVAMAQLSPNPAAPVSPDDAVAEITSP